MFGPVANALWGHYRRHPFQILLVWLGLTLGVALLVGVLSINQHAQKSYREGAKLFSNPYPFSIHHTQRTRRVPQAFYIDLRRAGFTQCVPVDRLQVVTPSLNDINLMGVDIIAMLPLLSERGLGEEPQTGISPVNAMTPPYPVYVGEAMANHKGWQDGQMITLLDYPAIGPLRIVDNDALSMGTYLVADMALLRSLSPHSGIAEVLCGELTQAERQHIRSVLPPALTLTKTQATRLGPLTRAFHLNLLAMGLLAFVVGLFIFYQAISLSMTQRQPLVGLLRQLGVDGRQLSLVMVAELFAWVSLGVVSGNVLGMILANQLLPAVATTLSDLYGADIDLVMHWQWQWGLYSVLLAILGAAMASAWPLVRLINTSPGRLSQRMTLIRGTHREYAVQAILAILLGVAAWGVAYWESSQWQGFTLIALTMLSAALALPYVCGGLFHALATRYAGARWRWFFTDAAASLSYRGVAAMAFMLAISAHIGMETMVGSFRTSTETWLQQRLAADVYVRPSNELLPRMASWLVEQDDVSQFWATYRRELAAPQGRLEVLSVGNRPLEKQALAVKAVQPDYWSQLHQQRAVLLSESLAAKFGVNVGEMVNLPAPMGERWQVAGVYYDYGNPYGQLVVSARGDVGQWLKQGRPSLAVVLNEDTKSDHFVNRINARFSLSNGQVQNQADIMRYAMRIFDRTFTVTESLCVLMLIVAIGGLFFSTLATELSRQRQYSLLRYLGLSGRELVALGGGQLVLLGLGSALVAIPLGLVLAGMLIHVVLKASFGWTMSMSFFPVSYATTIGLSMLALMVAGAWPVYRMLKRTAAASLRDAQ
ncbi:ABC transporter permease [Salinivibrio sp. ES.052]|uniref:ABC transporter permease n=1 Tax=Salinivibrio sp. ES.052 TaxID=1882823 RepID=UPI00092713C8|nr:ABC transporter permease [Salinivibrio sp. ES.052]SIN84985.1 putative ABC transport system permease protein [Salinivibrio sp. ES.052]